MNTTEFLILGGIIALISWRVWSKRFPFSRYPPKLPRRARRAMWDIAILATAKRAYEDSGHRAPLSDFSGSGPEFYKKVSRIKEYEQLRDSGRVITDAVDKLLSSRRSLSDSNQITLEYLKLLSSAVSEEAERELRDRRRENRFSGYGENELAAEFEAKWNAYRDRLKRKMK